MFEKLLEYQKLEREVLSLKHKLENDVSKITLNKVLVLVKDAQNKLLELEDKAKSSISEYEKDRREFDEAFKELERLNKQDTTGFDEEKLLQNIDKINQMSNLFISLERNLSYQAENINNILKNFETSKNNIVLSRQKYKECKEKYLTLENAIRPKIEEIKKQMNLLEKSIDENFLFKYKHLRQDRIFPVLVPFNHNACGGCSMEIPSALKNKLTEKGYLECEQCRRIIFLKK